MTTFSERVMRLPPTIQTDKTMTAPPSKLDRFFVIVTRTISLLLLLALLAGVVAVAYMWWSSSPKARPGAVKVEDKTTQSGKPVVLSFSKPIKVNNADTEILQLTMDNAAGEFSYGRASKTRNILFVGGTDKPARWLFADHRNVVWEIRQLHEDAELQEDLPALALYVEFAAYEPGGGGNNAAPETLDVGLTRPDGSGFTRVLKGVTKVFSHRIVDGRRMRVLFQRDTSVWQANISLDDFTVTGEHEIAKLPTAI
jgi:hypothetical protein